MSESRAAILSSELRRQERPTWTLRVMPDRLPCLYRAIDTVSHDSGGGAGHRFHLIAPVWEPYLGDIEAALAELSEEDFETFCIGEHSEGEEIAGRSSMLGVANQLLNEWFCE